MSGSRGRLSAAAQPLAPDRQQHPENDRTDEQAHEPERRQSPEHSEHHDQERDLCLAADEERRTMWSVQPITIPPQIRSPTPATVLPFNSSQATTQPQIVGAANGISPETVVSAARNTGAPVPATQ